MPRLLLVDDNPSIHKIAETLLARTGIELVCLETAAQALDLIERGERFDVALLDTAMAGMDGWELLEQLRKHPLTARIPIAMMAGVLDTVDPAKMHNAPIQGFLKKPVELRDLGDRIQKLLATPVESSPVVEPRPLASPFETMPATNLKDLPELRHLAEAAGKAEAVPAPEPVIAPVPDDSLDDLLILTEEDLLMEEEEGPGSVEFLGTSVSLEESPVEESLDLEELDLESLRELPPPEVQVAVLPTPIRPVPVTEEIADLTPPQGYASPDLQHEARATYDAAAFSLPPAPAAEREAFLKNDFVDLPDLGPLVDEPLNLEMVSQMEEPKALAEPEWPASPSSLEGNRIPPELEPHIDLTEDSDSLLSALGSSGTPLEPFAADLTETGLQEMPDTEILPDETEALSAEIPDDGGLEFLEETLSGIGSDFTLPDTAQSQPAELPEEDTAPGMEEVLPEAEASVVPIAAEREPAGTATGIVAPPAEALEKAKMTPAQRELLDAVLADPALMEALSKAVVTRLGDQVLREIAWEVIPELAERYPIH